MTQSEIEKKRFSTKRHTDIMIGCFVLGGKFFYLDIDTKTITNISFLQKAIKKEKENDFGNVDYDRLKLWKVEIPAGDDRLKLLTNTEIDIAAMAKDLGGAEYLDPMRDITRYFSETYDPPKEHVHIIVQPPPAITKPPTVKGIINIVLKNVAPSPVIVPSDIMPIMERNFDDAVIRITRNVQSCIRYSKAKADFDFIVSGGAPGIGKTRFGEELFKHLKKHWVLPKIENFPQWEKPKLHLEYLNLDFGNGSQLGPDDNDLDMTAILGLRIAYTFFIEGRYEMKFEPFCGRIWEHRKIFNINNVFDCIWEHLGLQLGQQLFIFLHIDEFQLIDRWKPEKQLFKEMVNTLAPFMLGPPSRIFVQTFLSGTAPQVVISAKESSRVSFGFVKCPQLSFTSMLKITNYYSQKFNAEKYNSGEYKWMLCRSFLQLLEDTGGLPRALQYVFEECFKLEDNGEKFFNNIYQQHFNTIFDSVKHRLQERYNIYATVERNKTLALELLYHSIDAIPVRRKTCLDPSDQDCTIENLERDAHIILNPCNATSSEFIIKMPFFFICIYNDRLQIVDKGLQEVFRVENDMHWQDWEIFVAHHDAFRTNLLIKRGKQTACLKELYRGAYGTQSTMNLEVRLKEISVVRAREQFPCLKLTEKSPKGDNRINWEKGENVVVNGTSARWGDGFVVRVTVQGQLLFIIHQDKFDYQSATFTNDNLLNEHIKNLETSIFGTKEKLLKIVSKYRHITIVFTTQPFENTESYDNCLVIASDNFEEYFGPVFSSRATFALTKDINPNFSEAERMEKRLPDIGKANAAKIVRNRPYTSKDHFYKKHQRARRGIENYEEKNPNKKIKLSFYPFDAL